ncbi:hypothetical protein [Sphingobacterium thalpophilum]|uniref:hypothetical protein n=1 Tax=Sphingobacterium thalpophilum TaxID=259 RepID=UPI003C741380
MSRTMNKTEIEQQKHQGVPVIAAAIVSQPGPEDFPGEIPNQPEEELPENDPNEQPEIPDEDDLGFDEEVGIEGENAFPEIDQEEWDQSANDAEGLPSEPMSPPSDLDETTI